MSVPNFDFSPGMGQRLGSAMTAEQERTRLIREIAAVLRDASMSDEARSAGLTFIGWLARRMPGEAASTAGVDEMCRGGLRGARKRPKPAGSCR
jgi:hypothetical protein